MGGGGAGVGGWGGIAMRCVLRVGRIVGFGFGRVWVVGKNGFEEIHWGKIENAERME